MDDVLMQMWLDFDRKNETDEHNKKIIAEICNQVIAKVEVEVPGGFIKNEAIFLVHDQPVIRWDFAVRADLMLAVRNSIPKWWRFIANQYGVLTAFGLEKLKKEMQQNAFKPKAMGVLEKIATIH